MPAFIKSEKDEKVWSIAKSCVCTSSDQRASRVGKAAFGILFWKQ